MQINKQNREIFNSTLVAMQLFHDAFGMKLSADVIAELHVAFYLNLSLPKLANNQGYDAIAEDGTRYQVKQRSTSSVVDMNNFDFDYIILVNLDEAYQVAGMWQMSAEQARNLASHRQYKGIDKYQITQSKFKKHAERLDNANKF